MAGCRISYFIFHISWRTFCTLIYILTYLFASVNLTKFFQIAIAIHNNSHDRHTGV